jgi:uncharacterized membrane protein
VQRKKVAVRDQPGVGGATHTGVVMMVMMLVGRTAIVFTVLLKGQLILVATMIAGAIFRRRTAIARISIGTFSDAKHLAYIRCVAGHFMATAHRLGQRQADRDEEDDESFSEEPHGVIICLVP